jgi:Na+/glutamate symporter
MREIDRRYFSLWKFDNIFDELAWSMLHSEAINIVSNVSISQVIALAING